MISRIYIIYNPKSTGPGRDNAMELKRQIYTKAPDIKVSLLPTTHPTHAVELARAHAGGSRTMIVSSSGDGGFHEVINGVLTSQYPDTIVGLLPSGNANDHYHSRTSGDLLDRIAEADAKIAPVLKIAWADQKMYAHSYAGLGFTAEIGNELNKVNLNLIREVVIVLSGLIRRRGIKIMVDGDLRHYDSLVFAVTGQMSKYIQTGAEQVDNEMIVITAPRRSFGWLIAHLLRRTRPPDHPTSTQQATFTTIRRSLMQCDGEVITLPARTRVTVTVEQILHEII